MSEYTDRLLSYWYRSSDSAPAYTHAATDRSPLCGDEVAFNLVVQDGVIKTANFKADGCCICECCTAMLAELATGKPPDWQLTEDEWKEYVGIDLKPNRSNCMMLPNRVLQLALRSPL